MSTLVSPQLTPSMTRGKGVWAAAATRFKTDHVGMASLVIVALFLLLVMMFKWIDNASMVGLVLKLTGYTYGPLLGLFAFGILTRRAVRDRWVPLVALAGPALCYVVDVNQKLLFGNYRLGLELLIMNGLLVFGGLLLISVPGQRRPHAV